MSRRLRNPFRIRASERLETDASFLQLYSPLALESLIEKNDNGVLWNNVLFIRSSPGGGKTSLLRVFEPSSLLTVYSRRSQEYRDLFRYLKDLEAVSDEGVKLLGVSITCNGNYESLEDLTINGGLKKRMFIALLNARIIMAALVGMLDLKRLKFPDDLSLIEYKYDNRSNFFKKITTPCNALGLYEWALQIEKNVFQLIDSFLPVSADGMEGEQELFSLSVLNPAYFIYDNQPICDRIVFMLDDAHKLSSVQRKFMISYLLEKRGQFSIWISERTEALESHEQIGSTRNRDYEEINLEKFWQDKPSKFRKTLISIADKRASSSTEDLNTFSQNLEDSIDEDTYSAQTSHAIESARARIRALSPTNDSKFANWISYVEKLLPNDYDKAIALRAVEILINRTLRKQQLSFDFAVTEDELAERLDQPVKDAALFFLSQEEKIPYFFGFDNLVKLTNNNIEQFLTFSSELFEDMLSAKIADENPGLKARVQEKRILQVVDNYWSDLIKKIPNGSMVVNFLQEFGDFARRETYKPNAPIAQGVTGFSIASPQSRIFLPDKWYDDIAYQPFLNVLSTCVAYNLLEPRDIIQGSKNQRNRVFYLNRWVCAKFRLPLAYGGWKHKQIDELLKWTK